MKFRSKPLKGIKKGSTAFKRGVEQATAFYGDPTCNTWPTDLCIAFLATATPAPTGYIDPLIQFEGSLFENDFWAGWKSVSKILGHE